MPKYLIYFITFSAFTALVFNNCGGPIHEGANLSSNNTCLAPVQAAFLDSGSYYDFVSTNCAVCHTSTGSASAYPFADADTSIAFTGFRLNTYLRLGEQATNAHGGAFTGSQWNSAISQLELDWAPIETDYDDCLSLQ